MPKTILFLLVCAVFSPACHIIEDGCEDDAWDDWDAGAPAEPNRPTPGDGGSTSTGSGGTSGDGTGNQPSSGGSAGSEPTPTPNIPTPTPCGQESDCERGFNCDYELYECTPADAETCSELESERSCDQRNDCVTVYAGTNCSCGAECSCIGGEPGCVCESFEFFRCVTLDE